MSGVRWGREEGALWNEINALVGSPGFSLLSAV